MKTKDEVRAAIRGPVASIKTPFHRDGEIDWKGLRRQVDFIVEAGVGTIILTYGDSLYTILTDDEVAQMTKVTVEQAAGRALVVAADRIWARPKEVAFARYCREVGADMLMVLPPDWAQSCTAETMVDHYAAAAEHIPGMAFGLKVLKLAMERVDGIWAVKDDMCGEFARRMCMLVGEKWATFSGGQKQNHFDVWPYGVDGYLATYVDFAPSVTWAYWQAIEKGDAAAARDIIRDYDMPLFDLVCGFEGGFDSGTHGAMELFGIIERWRRPPYKTITDAEMEKLRAFFREKKLL